MRIILTLLITLFLFANLQAQVFIPAGQAPMLPADEFLMGVRFRNFRSSGPSGNDELYLGVPDLGVASNRVAQQLTFAASHDFIINYSSSGDSLECITTIGGSSFRRVMFNISSAATAAGKTRPLSSMNVVQFRLRNQTGASTTTLSGINLNGVSVPGIFQVTGNSTNYWHAFSIAYGSSFSLSGSFQLSGNYGTSVEGNVVEILFGSSIQLLPTSVIENFTAIEKTNANQIAFKLNNNTDIQSIHLLKSIDGINFIATKTSLSLNTQQDLIYDYAFSQTNFYKLELVYTDGSKQYSKIIKVERSSSIEPKIKSTGNALEITSNETLSIKILDLSGRLLYTASDRKNYYITNLKQGQVYIVQLFTKQKTISKKLLL